VRPLSSRELLAVWERGQGVPAQRRALLLLAAATPRVTAEAMSDLSVGERDWRLFRLREWAFGPRMASLSNCPHCSCVVEFEMDVRDVCPDEPPRSERVLHVQVEGYEVEFRLPTAGDMTAIEMCPDAGEAERQLLERCVLDLRRDGTSIGTSRLTRATVQAIDTSMSEADRQSNPGLRFTCPECAVEWIAPFDIGGFFWSEIDAWAVRLLRTVHALASAYGWREDDVLALSPWRRQLYLEMSGR
jgi:hypothetical protein